MARIIYLHHHREAVPGTEADIDDDQAAILVRSKRAKYIDTSLPKAKNNPRAAAKKSAAKKTNTADKTGAKNPVPPAQPAKMNGQ